MWRLSSILLCLPFTACLVGGGRGPDAAFDNFVLITLDTLRADHLGCYGYPRPTSPFLDSLADGGVLFTQAVASSSHTAPAHASIFTSRYPQQHQVLANGERFRRRTATLAALARQAGFSTAAFVSVRFLGGLRLGFETFDARTPARRVSRPAHRTVDAALRWFKQREPSQRFFLWIHFYDPHETDDRSHVSIDDLEGMRRASRQAGDAFVRFLENRHGLPAELAADAVDHFDRYDAQIAFLDSQLRRLFESVGASIGDARTLWAITADHGEGMGSHHYFGHDKHLYQEQLRVPLILFGAGGGRRVDHLVRHVDLLPTLADLAGIPVDRQGLELEGHSLVPLLRDPEAKLPIDYAFAQRRPAGRPGKAYIGPKNELLIAAQTEHFKYILRSTGSDELYDLVSDPLELENLIDHSLPEEQQLAAWLRAKFREMVRQTHAEEGDRAPLDDDIVRELRALGYM